jgi:KDO2-lipid IV(A) lauroyltransferase
VVGEAVARVRSQAVDLGFAAGWRVVRALPDGLAGSLFERGADRGFRRNGAGVRQLRRNLRRVIGPAATEIALDDVVHAALRSYARYWKETFRLPAMDKADVVARVRAPGAEHIDAAAAAGNGFILALPHSGNWDVAGLWLLARGYPFTTVAERLKPESVYNRFVAYREGLGMEIVALTGGPRPPTEVLTERLREGLGVCLLGDRDLSARGVEVKFFGEAARFPPGPAMLAAITGAALIPVCLSYEPDGWRQVISPPIELPDGRLRDRVRYGTQALADVFAEQIAEHPADWHMLQKLWSADLERRR